MAHHFLLKALVFIFPMTAAFAGSVEKTLLPRNASAECLVDVEQMMRLDSDKFDQDMNGGWRLLARRKGCEKAAAELMKTYISRNWGQIKQANLHALYWHVGQMEAFAGNHKQAVPFLMSGVNPETTRQEMGFYEYSLGTISFLNGDLVGLKAARRRLSALPEPIWYSKELAAGRVTKWPANLSVLDALIKCFGYSYSVAYSGNCSPNIVNP